MEQYKFKGTPIYVLLVSPTSKFHPIRFITDIIFTDNRIILVSPYGVYGVMVSLKFSGKNKNHKVKISTTIHLLLWEKKTIGKEIQEKIAYDVW